MGTVQTITRAELLERTGVDDLVLTFWLRQELICPNPRTRPGEHRRFPFHEANLAAILLQLHSFGANVSALKGVSDIYRDALNWGKALDLSHRDAVAITSVANMIMESPDRLKQIEDDRPALWGDMEALQKQLDETFSGKLQLTLRHLQIAADLCANPLDHVNLAIPFMEITMQPVAKPVSYSTLFWPRDGAWKRGTGGGGQQRASDDGVFATMAIDVVSILYHVWNRP